MEGNSICIIASVFPRKYLLVFKFNRFSTRPKESEIHEWSGRKPLRNPQFNKVMICKEPLFSFFLKRSH